jgi:hypothetical protein
VTGPATCLPAESAPRTLVAGSMHLFASLTAEESLTLGTAAGIEAAGGGNPARRP